MITSEGKIVAGSFWDPEKSPYSIPDNGDVVKALTIWFHMGRGNAWSSSNDYMHFSSCGG
jgi:hypothetical protein